MASSDLRDVLNLPDGSAGPRPSKKQRLSAPRPNLKGLAREVHNLGGDNPIAIVPQVSQFKKRRLASRKPAAKWELKTFKNSAREDPSLLLQHWRRKVDAERRDDDQQAEGEAPPPADDIEDSLFAKYNVQVSVPQYSDDQYNQSLQNDDWSKEETDYLMGLASDFDLRWPLIWDRYEWNPPATNGEASVDGDESKAIVPVSRTRSLETLKARYYEVAAKMMAAQKPVQYMTQPEYALHELMAHYNPQQEKLRKDFAVNSLARSREEAREEESLLLEIKRILARSERFNEERRELYNRLDYPHAETDINTFKSSAGLQTLLQNLMSVDKSKKRKSIMGADGVTSSGQATPQTGTGDSAKRENASAQAGNREQAGAVATPTAGNKKAQQQPTERRKLNAQQEAIYGVTHHDRLSSGPTFRTEKINKLFSHKSNQQQLRISNTLNELDVPNKLAMPTTGTTQAYELLLGAVNSLLDARKVSDKIDAEIKLELAKKTEREKAQAPPEDEKTKNDEPKATDKAGDGSASVTEDAAATSTAPADEARKSDAADDKPAETKGTDKTKDSSTTAVSKKGDGDDKEEAEVKLSAEAEDKEASLKQEDQRLLRERSARPGSSGGPTHKRSASVLSSVSDKSAKRQKK